MIWHILGCRSLRLVALGGLLAIATLMAVDQHTPVPVWPGVWAVNLAVMAMIFTAAHRDPLGCRHCPTPTPPEDGTHLPTLRRYHQAMGDRRSRWLLIGAILVCALLAAITMVVWRPWGELAPWVVLLPTAAVADTARYHTRLALWCPWCFWSGGGGYPPHVPEPDPQMQYTL